MACPGGVVDVVSPGSIAVGTGCVTVGVIGSGGIAFGPGDGSPGGGIAGFRGSRKCLELVKV